MCVCADKDHEKLRKPKKTKKTWVLVFFLGQEDYSLSFDKVVFCSDFCLENWPKTFRETARKPIKNYLCKTPQQRGMGSSELFPVGTLQKTTKKSCYFDAIQFDVIRVSLTWMKLIRTTSIRCGLPGLLFAVCCRCALLFVDCCLLFVVCFVVCRWLGVACGLVLGCCLCLVLSVDCCLLSVDWCWLFPTRHVGVARF